MIWVRFVPFPISIYFPFDIRCWVRKIEPEVMNGISMEGATKSPNLKSPNKKSPTVDKS